MSARSLRIAEITRCAADRERFERMRPCLGPATIELILFLSQRGSMTPWSWAAESAEAQAAARVLIDLASPEAIPYMQLSLRPRKTGAERAPRPQRLSPVEVGTLDDNEQYEQCSLDHGVAAGAKGKTA